MYDDVYDLSRLYTIHYEDIEVEISRLQSSRAVGRLVCAAPSGTIPVRGAFRAFQKFWSSASEMRGAYKSE